MAGDENNSSFGIVGASEHVLLCSFSGEEEQLEARVIFK